VLSAFGLTNKVLAANPVSSAEELVTRRLDRKSCRACRATISSFRASPQNGRTVVSVVSQWDMTGLEVSSSMPVDAQNFEVK
jgi:hypothetical protein